MSLQQLEAAKFGANQIADGVDKANAVPAPTLLTAQVNDTVNKGCDEADDAINKEMVSLGEEVLSGGEEILSEWFDNDSICGCIYAVWNAVTDQPVFRPMSKCKEYIQTKMEKALVESKRSAFFHFIIVEMLGFYIFWSTQYVSNKKMINTIKMDLDSQPLNLDVLGYNATLKSLSNCVSDTTNDEVWMQPTYDFHHSCYGIGVAEMEMNEYAGIFGSINIGCFVMCALIVGMCIRTYARELGISSPLNHGDGTYIQFCYQLVRTKAYRFMTGLLVFLTVATILMFLISAYKAAGLWWVMQSFGVDMVVLAILSWRAHRPWCPRFQYNTSKFAALAFKRANFISSNATFAHELTSALISAQGSMISRSGKHIEGTETKFKNMLKDPSNWKNALDVLKQMNPPEERSKLLAGIKKANDLMQAIPSQSEP